MKILLSKVKELLWIIYLTSTHEEVYVSFLRKRGESEQFFYDLALKHGSDKSGGDSGRKFSWLAHNYESIYGSLYRSQSQRDAVELVLEVGIGSSIEGLPSSMGSHYTPGNSLRLWRSFFINAQIVGFDIDPTTLFFDRNISCYLADQTSAASLSDACDQATLKSQIDLIVDDGLHTFEAGTQTFVNLFELLSENGNYVIEDVGIYDLKLYIEFFRGISNIVFTINIFHRWRLVDDNCCILISKAESP